jgi:hypothetical protein
MANSSPPSSKSGVPEAMPSDRSANAVDDASQEDQEEDDDDIRYLS